MNPAWVAMRPKLVVLMALLVDSLPNFAVLVRLRISNRISPELAAAEARLLREHEIDVLAELIQRAVDRPRRVAVLADARVRERRGVEVPGVGMSLGRDAIRRRCPRYSDRRSGSAAAGRRTARGSHPTCRGSSPRSTASRSPARRPPTHSSRRAARGHAAVFFGPGSRTIGARMIRCGEL